MPDSVVGFMAGELGDLPGGWPEPFRSKVLKGRTPKIGIEPLSDEDLTALEASPAERRGALNRLLFAGPTRTFLQWRETYGDLSALNTPDYLYGLQRGHRARGRDGQGHHPVRRASRRSATWTTPACAPSMATLNGQLRPVLVRDLSVDVKVTSGGEGRSRRARVTSVRRSPASSRSSIEEGATVEPGQPVASIEAMKMEAAITAPVAGVVRRIALQKPQQVEAGDLILEIVS